MSEIKWRLVHWLLTDSDVNPEIEHPLVRDAVKQCADVIAPMTQGKPVDVEAAAQAAAAATKAAEAAEAAADSTEWPMKWSAQWAATAARSAEQAVSAAAASTVPVDFVVAAVSQAVIASRWSAAQSVRVAITSKLRSLEAA